MLEQQYIFPRFLQAQQHVQLIQTLLIQHNAARCLTNMILQLLASFTGSASQCYQLANLLSAYIRMYEPHSAREDTVVFPAFHNLVSEKTFKHLYTLMGQVLTVRNINNNKIFYCCKTN